MSCHVLFIVCCGVRISSTLHASPLVFTFKLTSTNLSIYLYIQVGVDKCEVGCVDDLRDIADISEQGELGDIPDIKHLQFCSHKLNLGTYSQADENEDQEEKDRKLHRMGLFTALAIVSVIHWH